MVALRSLSVSSASISTDAVRSSTSNWSYLALNPLLGYLTCRHYVPHY